MCWGIRKTAGSKLAAADVVRWSVKEGGAIFYNYNMVKSTRPRCVFCAYAVDFVIMIEVNFPWPSPHEKLNNALESIYNSRRWLERPLNLRIWYTKERIFVLFIFWNWSRFNKSPKVFFDAMRSKMIKFSIDSGQCLSTFGQAWEGFGYRCWATLR